MLEFSETLGKNEQSRYKNYFDIPDPGKIRVFEPQGGKGWAKCPEMAKNDPFWSRTLDPFIQFL